MALFVLERDRFLPLTFGTGSRGASGSGLPPCFAADALLPGASLYLLFADLRCATVDGAARWLCACWLPDRRRIAGGERHLERRVQLT